MAARQRSGAVSQSETARGRGTIVSGYVTQCHGWGGRTYAIAHGIPHLHARPYRVDVVVADEQLAGLVAVSIDDSVVAGNDALGCVFTGKAGAGPGRAWV